MMRKSKEILILRGGKNEEHEISLKTANEVGKALKKLGYKIDYLDVNPKTFINDIKKFNPFCCFNALHGTFGEDGKIQKILFDKKIPYTHSGIQSSSIAFNKNQTKKKLINSEVTMLKSKLINIRKINKKILINFYKKNDSFVIKPNSSGSSYGVIIIKTLKDIDKFFQKNYKRKIYKEHKEILIEKFVKGKELTVTVIEENKLTKPVEVTEINYKNKFFDYKTKYNLGLSKHIIPANLSLKIYKKCLKFSKIAHDTIGCNGITRTDLILDENTNKLYFLEINTQPGLTPVSLVPEQLAIKGISFIEMINLLIKNSKCKN